MARLGVDYSFDPPSVAELQTAGATFAVRYVSEPGHPKNLTLAEAQRLSAAGLDVAVVFQRSKAFMLEGPEAGIADATSALEQAQGCGMPAGRPIYFALDIDPNPLTASQWTAVAQYLQGAALVIGRDRVGVYGGRKAIEDLVPLWAAWGWQTRSWSGGVWSSKAHLHQYEHNTPLGSGLVDWDRAVTDDFGQWKAGEMGRYPGAQWKRLPGDEPAIRPRAVVFHTMAMDGGLPVCDAYFRSGRSGGIESHFGVGGPWEGVEYDGQVWQWRDTLEQADANFHANAFGVSIETSDGGDPSRPWSPKQLAALVRLGNWLADAHGIPRRLCPTWDQGGFGWHVMFGAPGQWTPVAKVCPGAVRIAQLKDIVLPAIFAGRELEDDMFEQPDRDKLAAIHAGLIVPGTTTPDQTIDLLFSRVRSIEQGMVVPGTTSVAQAFELLFDRVRTIEDAVTAPPSPLPEIEIPPPVTVQVDEQAAAALASALAADAAFVDALATRIAVDLAGRLAE